MAAELIVSGLVGEAIAKLSDVVIHVIKTTAKFKSNLRRLQQVLSNITPIFEDIERLNKLLDARKSETALFVTSLGNAVLLVEKCVRIKWYSYKRYTHSLKLDELEQSLRDFFQFEVQLQQARDTKQALVGINDLKAKLDQLSASGSSSVPVLQGMVIGFELPLCDLKAKVLNDSLVVVVSAAGGCGKTTLVTRLCHDEEIKAKFGNNIFFVTVANTPNVLAIVNKLFPSKQYQDQTEVDAIIRLGSLLRNIKSDILLVLDDVWDYKVIDKFEFDIPGYKVLVTSRLVIPRFDTYMLEPLSKEDATTLFRLSAFSEGGNKSTKIPNDLVNKMVECCKKYPLALSVVGRSLNGMPLVTWQTTLKRLSEGESVLDLDKDMLARLGKSIDVLDDKYKECYLDLGLFPEDQRIPATALMDMWVELYSHDKEGMETFGNLVQLSYRSLANIMPESKDSKAIIGYCDEQFVTQHDMLRDLAITLSSQEPIAQRKRLIVDARVKELPEWIKQVQQPLETRLLSISTGEKFSPKLHDLRVPNVEVLVLNCMSKNYTLPKFMEKVDKLKVLIVANDGLYATKLEYFPPAHSLSSLARIRLERVSFSSLGKSILELVNLQKLSLIWCEIGKAFEECNTGIANILPNLEEIEMSYCHDLVRFPAVLCKVRSIKKLSITNCHELGILHPEFGMLTNLEVLMLTSCTKLAELPESFGNLSELSILDISDCLKIRKLPESIGKLSNLRSIHMKGCRGLRGLPSSVEDLCKLEVVCDEEISYWWSDYPGVTINLVEEDKYGNLMKVVSADMFS